MGSRVQVAELRTGGYIIAHSKQIGNFTKKEGF